MVAAAGGSNGRSSNMVVVAAAAAAAAEIGNGGVITRGTWPIFVWSCFPPFYTSISRHIFGIFFEFPPYLSYLSSSRHIFRIFRIFRVPAISFASIVDGR